MKSIYFDNAASGGYKPDCVKKAVLQALENPANPGRSGHKAALAAALIVANARDNTAKFFGAEGGNVVFTYNCTAALNFAIFGGISGDHVVTTAFEHNSVLRPLDYLKRSGVIDYTVVYPDSSGVIRAKEFLDKIRRDTKMIIVNHVSNVTGARAPIEEIGYCADRYGIPFLVDAAQSAGHININMKDTKINILAAAGHKGLAAPQGVGVLALAEGVTLRPIIMGGTGSLSESPLQPEDLPDSLESGTISTPAIAGLNAGIIWIKENFKHFSKKIYGMTFLLYNELKKIPQVIVYTPRGHYNGIVAFNIEGLAAGQVANILDEKFDIYVRAGLHCAPLAHKFLGTIKYGAVRASLSYQNTFEEIETFINAIKSITKSF
ncbi:MAG: aminotransferase class V-fold PLP-dependent enzyme [Clostridiales bacterium]|nr:aminotransferase class V-fold PLP-dependent enzyme [Clostridiales bacterium]